MYGPLGLWDRFSKIGIHRNNKKSSRILYIFKDIQLLFSMIWNFYALCSDYGWFSSKTWRELVFATLRYWDIPRPRLWWSDFFASFKTRTSSKKHHKQSKSSTKTTRKTKDVSVSDKIIAVESPSLEEFVIRYRQIDKEPWFHYQNLQQ